MPVDHKKSSTFISQREQYQKGGIGRWYWDHRDNKIFDFINNSHGNIIDVGCGEGITLEKLVNKYPKKNIIGIDVVPENIRICKKYNLPAVLGSVYDLKIESGSIDLCIFSEVIEHLNNVDLAIANIWRILKIGGDVIIVFPNDRMFKITRLIFLKFKEAFADVGHVNQFTPKNIKEILIKKGFTISKVINIPLKFWVLSLHCIVSAKKI